jgi:hypothetical protein
MHNGISLSYVTHLGKVLSASASYSIYNRSYNNFGLGLTVNGGPVQLYIVTDNILGVFIPHKAKNLHLRCGINLTFGRKEKEKASSKL